MKVPVGACSTTGRGLPDGPVLPEGPLGRDASGKQRLSMENDDEESADRHDLRVSYYAYLLKKSSRKRQEL